MSEDKVYKPEAYFVAAFGLAMMSADAETIKGLSRSNDFSKFFQDFYSREITDEMLDKTLRLMSDSELLDIDDDPYAGRYITTQKTAFTSQFKNLAEQVPDSPLAVILRGRKPWMDSVFASDEFWEHVSEDTESGPDDKSELDEIPASDRSVTLLHNSPERKEIEEGLTELTETLRTSNEIAEQLGEDRERISAELEAAKIALKPERIRLGYIKDSILRVLRELGAKLKEKAIDLGVDRLIALFEAILEHFL